MHGPHRLSKFEIPEISLDARGTGQGGRSKDLRWEVDTCCQGPGQGVILSHEDSTRGCNGQTPPWTTVQKRNCRCTTVRVGAKMERIWGCGRIVVSRSPGRKLCQLGDLELAVALVTEPRRSLFSRDIGLSAAHPTLRLYTGLADSQHNDCAKRLLTSGLVSSGSDSGAIADLLSEAGITVSRQRLCYLPRSFIPIGHHICTM